MADVLLPARDEQEMEDAGEFYDRMLDYIDEVPTVGLGLGSHGAAEGAQ